MSTIEKTHAEWLAESAGFAKAIAHELRNNLPGVLDAELLEELRAMNRVLAQVESGLLPGTTEELHALRNRAQLVWCELDAMIQAVARVETVIRAREAA